MQTLQPAHYHAGNDALACQRPRNFLAKRDKPPVKTPAQQEEETGRFVAAFLGHSTSSMGKRHRKKSNCMHLWSGEVEEQPQKIHSLTDEEIAKCTRKYKLSKSQMRECVEAFMVFDVDRNGCVTIDNLGTVMAALQLETSPQELEHLMSGVDKNNTGSVDFDAFLDLMCKRKHSDTDEELAEAFQMLDADGDGFISVDELFESLNGLDEAVSRYEVTCMIEAADTDGDGQVNLSDFKSIMRTK